MARPASNHPTELELSILNLLWEDSPRTVRDVRDALAGDGRDLAHTSVITTLGTMVEKGQVKRLPPAEGKAFRFAPRIKQQTVSRQMLGDLVQRVFGGSAESVILGLFELEHVDDAEIRRLRNLLNKRLREEKT